MTVRSGVNAHRPIICVIDAATHMTGALNAARQEAALLSEQARFILLVPLDYALADSETPEFERVIRLPIASLHRSVRSAAGYLPDLVRSGMALKSALRSLGCDRLQVNDFYLAPAFAAAIAGFRGRIVTWIRVDPRRFGLVGRWWLGLARHCSSHLVAVSEFIRTTVPSIRTTTLIYDPSPSVQPVTPRGQQLLFIGNYVPGKGQDMAIAAFHLIANEFPDASLLFHGSTMDLAKNEAYLERLRDQAAGGTGRDRIALKGFLSDKAGAFGSSLASLTCSDTESFSLTCQEASAYGLPVIATRCGGPEEIVIDGETGFLVGVGDVEQLADRLRTILADGDTARSMGAKGAELMRELFGREAFVHKVAELFSLPAAPSVAKDGTASRWAAQGRE
jgi:L-malate glycosyltransferase